VNWTIVDGSSWVRAIAYAEESEQIYVEFLDGHQHVYNDCSRELWEEFSAEGTSPGGFIHSTLNRHGHGPA
jgi:hypothetical protein